MNERNGIFIRVITGSVIIAIVLFAVLVSLAPDAVQFSPNNYGSNGIQQVYSKYQIQLINSLSLAKVDQQQRQSSSVLLIIQPVTNFTPSDARTVVNFVENGGKVVIADSFGRSNSLLEGMDLRMSIQSGLVILDPIYNWNGSSSPTALTLPSVQHEYRFLSGVSGLALKEPSPIIVSAGSSARIVATSSTMSYAIVMTPSSEVVPSTGGTVQPVAKGPLPIAAVVRIGNGTVVVIGDSKFFTNAIWEIDDNPILIGNLLSNSTVYLDTSHWPINADPALKAEIGSIYLQLSQYPLRYVLTLGFVGVAIWLVPVFVAVAATTSGTRSREVEPNNDGSGQIYDEHILNRIRKDRQRYGVQQPE